MIDGNNLLGSWGGPRGRDPGRAEVLRRVSAFCRAKNARAIVVFDGEPLRPDVRVPALGPLEVHTPQPGEDADTVIRRIVDRAARPTELIVVTSDKALYSYARTAGASILRAHEWNALARASVRRAGGEEGEKPEREHDVEGWLKTFGST